MAEETIQKNKAELAKLQGFAVEYVLLKEKLFAPNRKVTVNGETLENDGKKWTVFAEYHRKEFRPRFFDAFGNRWYSDRRQIHLPDELFINPFKTLNALKRELRDRKTKRWEQKNHSHACRSFHILKMMQENFSQPDPEASWQLTLIR